MDTAEKERLPNILQVFRTDKEQPPDNAVYKAKISNYLTIFVSNNPHTVAAIIYETHNELFGSIWKKLFDDKKRKGELGNINLTWWEARGNHRVVDADFYLKHWKENYSSLAENWHDIQANPTSIERISDRIIKGITELLFAREYEDTIFATLKYHRQTYPRLGERSVQSNPPSQYRDKYGWLVNEVAEYASTLPLNDAISFLAELSGAYILSCPVKHIMSEPSFPEVAQENITYSSEEQGVLVLLRYICLYGSQELAMSASEFPLRYMQRPGEEWKYIIEVPGSS